MKVRVVLADDHLLVLEGLQKLLEPQCEVVGTVTDGRALVELALELRPDVVLVDIGMPLLNGLNAIQKLKARMPEIKPICLTMHEDPELATDAMRVGASGYVLKTSAAGELFHAIEEALRGRVYISPTVVRGMEESFIRDPRPKEGPRSLTPRQREVTQLLAEGKSLKQAAHLLNVTPRTVAFHKYKIMDELRLKTTADLVRFAVRNHLVT